MSHKIPSDSTAVTFNDAFPIFGFLLGGQLKRTPLYIAERFKTLVSDCPVGVEGKWGFYSFYYFNVSINISMF